MGVLLLRWPPLILWVAAHLLLLLDCAGSTSHSLRYFETAVSEPGQGLPQFITVGYVDDEQFVQYDSDTKEALPHIPWIRKVEKEDPQYWHTETQNMQGTELWYRKSLPILQNRYNQSGASESRDSYLAQFDCYLQANELTQVSQERKRGLFLSLYGPEVFETARALVAPVAVQATPWDTIQEKLRNHYAPKPSKIAARHAFYHQNQAEVVEGQRPSLLGLDWFDALGLEVTGIKRISNAETEGLVKDFAEVFDGTLGQYTGTPISFSLDPQVAPIKLKPRRIPFALKTKVDEQLDKLIAQGVLEPVDHAKWETPIVTHVKPDGSVRICADYKCTINKALQQHTYPVPVVQHLLHSLGEGKVFAKLDLAQAYQQLPVDDATAEAQTIVTHRGAFRCRRLQFGVSVAPGIFRSLMERLLQGLPGVVPYFDDVLVSADSNQQQFERLRAMLTRFQEAGFIC